MHLLKFYVDNDGVPIMKYKKSTVDPKWLPFDRPSQCLWKKDHYGQPMLPLSCLKPTPFKPMWNSKVSKPTGNKEKGREVVRKAIVNNNFILLGLERHIQYWQNTISKCKGFATTFSPYVEY